MMAQRSAPPFQGRGFRGGCARLRADKESAAFALKRSGGIEPPDRSPTPIPSLEREGL